MVKGGNAASRAAVWECEVDGEWVPYGADITAQLEKACRDGERSVPYERKGTRYVINLIIMHQALDSPDSQHGLLVRRLESSNVEVEALLRTIRERMLESEADTARREQQQRELAVAIAQARAEAQRERQSGAAELVWRAPQQTITVGAVQGTRRSVTRADIKDSRVTRDIEQFHAASGHFWELMNCPGAAKNLAHLGLGNVMPTTVTRVDVYESAATREAYDKMRAQLADDRRDTQETWVFHGSDRKNVKKICVGGFKVGGDGIAVKNGAIYGNGVYTAIGPSAPLSYATSHGAHSKGCVILARAMKGRHTRQSNWLNSPDAGDSWGTADANGTKPAGTEDWVVFRATAQLLPVYVVHFE
ncbi:hypothetical protein JKP88DRAFT_316418 [Tribonema minus]|uniref:WWE domain-containing protein n=1 Tax=Tribonema minus TaxID=303371 RepID=A0A836CFU3_9STRA|nr:hypothetical protein JKP88DRAFT_316418 [Tribonema minus]